MPALSEYPGLHDRIRAVIRGQQPKLSTDGFGEAINVSGGAVRNWISGKGGISLDNLAAISETFNVSQSWLLTGEGHMGQSPRTLTQTARAQVGPDGLLPVRAGQRTHNGYFRITDTIIESIARPQPLVNRSDGYGVLVPSDAMAPAFRFSDIAVVDPVLPPSIDCDVLAVCKLATEHGEELHGLIGTLVEFTDESWTVETIHPKRNSHTLPRNEWDVLRIVAKIARR